MVSRRTLFLILEVYLSFRLFQSTRISSLIIVRIMVWSLERCLTWSPWNPRRQICLLLVLVVQKRWGWVIPLSKSFLRGHWGLDWRKMAVFKRSDFRDLSFHLCGSSEPSLSFLLTSFWCYLVEVYVLEHLDTVFNL